jgi:hypothetical protein
MILSTLVFSPAARAEPTKQECVAANDRAQDLRQAGKLRAARVELAVCIATACPGPVREDCAQRLSEIDAAQPRLVFSAKDAAGNDLDAVRVTVDGAPFADRLDGAAIDVDPGEHAFRFEAADGAAAEKTVVVREGEKRRMVGVVLRRAPEQGSSGWGAYAAFGAGGVGLVVGTVLGVMALSTKSSLDAACGPSRTGCPEGEVSTLSTRAWGADIGLGVAIVGAAAGTALLLVSHSPSSRRSARVFPWVGVMSGGVGGRFQ